MTEFIIEVTATTTSTTTVKTVKVDGNSVNEALSNALDLMPMASSAKVMFVGGFKFDNNLHR